MRIDRLAVTGMLAFAAPALSQGVVTARNVGECAAAAQALADNYRTKMTDDARRRFRNPKDQADAIARVQRDAAELGRTRLSECESAFSRGRTAPWTMSLR